ncbi:glycoside hydrolase [Armillaria fumosa]|nr:glycoside hydrolase [Armillaria fumosa]
MFKATLVASLLASIASVRGHGYVETIVADGTEYSGYLPYSDSYYNPVPDRIVRPIPGNGPVIDLSLIECVFRLTSAFYLTILAFNAMATPMEVSKVPLPLQSTRLLPLDQRWLDVDNLAGLSHGSNNHVHGNAVWFKVDELGKTDDGLWAATDVLSAQDSVWTFTIPAKLKAGQYIIRHEMRFVPK